MILGFETSALAVSILAVFVGTLVQRLAGQGLGLVAAPIVALVAPEVLPAALLFVGIFVGLGSVSVDTKALSIRELPPGFAGRAVGAIIAAWVAASLATPEAIGPIVAGVVYLGIALSLIGVRVPITSISLFSAGTAAGVMATLTGIGAPPMALLYQHEAQRRSTAMQNTFFFFGMLVSVSALGWYGLLTTKALIFAGLLLPGVLLGLLVARPLSERVARAAIRPWALGLAGLAATTLLIRQL